MEKKNLSKSSTAVISIIIAWVFYMFLYVARVEPGVLINDLMGEFHITSYTVGFIVSVLYIPYVILQIPAGIITDKFGAKKILTVSGMLSLLGIIIFGTASSVWALELGRFFLGIAAAPAFLCCSKIAGDMFDSSKYSMLMAVAMLMGCFGGIFGTAPTAYLVTFIGWHNTTYVIAIIGLFITLLAFFFVKDTKFEKDKKNENLLEGLKILVKTPRAWVLGLYGVITYLPLCAVAELWIVPFMELRYDIPTQTAAFASIAVFAGFGIGGILAAYIAERIKSYKKTIITFTMGLLLTMYVAIYNDSITFEVNMAVLFLVGIFAGANTLCFTLAYDLVPDQYSGTSTGFMNALIMTSGIMFLPLLGKLLDFFRNGMIKENGVPYYNISMYRSAFLVIMLSIVLAVVITFFIRDLKKYHKSKEEVAN